MGLVTSMFCTITFCVERILTCTCCAFLLILMLFGVLLMLVYGVSIGYHFSQKELANYAVQRRDAGSGSERRSGGGPVAGGEGEPGDFAPYVKLVAVNDTARESLRRAGVEERSKDMELVMPSTIKLPLVKLPSPTTERPPEIRNKEYVQRSFNGYPKPYPIVRRPYLDSDDRQPPPPQNMPWPNPVPQEEPPIPLQDSEFGPLMKRASEDSGAGAGVGGGEGDGGPGTEGGAPFELGGGGGSGGGGGDYSYHPLRR